LKFALYIHHGIAQKLYASRSVHAFHSQAPEQPVAALLRRKAA